MRNHKFKHFVLIIATIFSVMVPAFFLSACGGEDSSNSLDGVYLQIGDNNEFLSSTAYYEAEYGFKFNRPDVLNWDQLKIIFEYRDGTRKDQYNLDEKDAKEIGDEYWEKYYRDLQVEGEVRTEELSKENFIDKVLDVGFYKVVLHVAGRDLELNVSINQPTSSVNQPKLSYCIAPKSADLSYANQYYNKFKFACPQYKDDFSDENYDSDYKLYVFESNNKKVSGSKVTAVYGMPKYANEDREYDFSDGNKSRKLNIKTGDDLLKIYNSLEPEFKSQFIFNLSSMLNVQGKVNADNTLVVRTDYPAFVPGDYYYIAEYFDPNLGNFMVEPDPNNVFKVEKGDFVWKNTLYKEGFPYNENEADNLIENLNLNLNYSFDFKKDKFGTETTRALTVSDLLNEKIEYSDEYFNGWSMYVLNGGTGVAPEFEIYVTNYGKAKYLNDQQEWKDINGFDCRDNGIVLQCRLKLDDYYAKYYNDDKTLYKVTVNFNKGCVQKPVMTNQQFVYNGELQAPDISTQNCDDYYIITSEGLNQITRRNVGDYKVNYKLKDPYNYYVQDADDSEDYVTGKDFDWSIEKITLDEYEFWKTYTYNGVTTEQMGPTDTTSVVYVPGQKSIVVTLTSMSTNYQLIKGHTNARLELTVNDLYNNFDNPRITETQELPNGCQFVFAFDGTKDNTNSYLNIEMHLAGTNISNEWSPVNAVQISVDKKNYTEQELTAIYGNYFQLDGQEYVIHSDCQYVIDQVTRKLPTQANPAYDTQTTGVTTDLGSWKIYYEVWTDNNNTRVRHEINPGEAVPENVILDQLYYSFKPNDEMYFSLPEVIYNISWVKGDMSQEDLADLLEEFGSDRYTESNGTYQANFDIEINVGESSYGIVPTEYNKIPVHDDNQEFKGRWKLVFDVNGEEKEFISNQTSEYTNEITKEALESANCNWRIKFQPQDERYKPLYIQVNITINQL